MLYANQSDCKKIEAKTAEILSAAINDKIVVDFKKFYDACHLQELRRVKFGDEVSDILTGTKLVQQELLRIEFGDEVSDILTGTKFVQQHGLWVFVPDYDAGYSLFIRVAAPHRRASTEYLLRCGILTEHVLESGAVDDATITEIE